MTGPSSEPNYYGEATILSLGQDCVPAPHWHKDVMGTALQILWHDPGRGVTAARQFSVPQELLDNLRQLTPARFEHVSESK